MMNAAKGAQLLNY